MYLRRGLSSKDRDYRGFFRLLTELHIPFRVTDRIDSLNLAHTDLVVVPRGPTPEVLEEYVANGGSLLVAGSEHPSCGVPRQIKLWRDTKAAYVRIEDATSFPSLQNTWAIFLAGDFLELEKSESEVTFIPPSQFGPPDKVARVEDIRTDTPGLVMRDFGQGNIAFIPWHIGGLYYEVSDLVDRLLSGKGRQVMTNAHPSVEVTLMQQPEKDRVLLHLVNMSGHSGTAFFEAIPMHDLSFRIRGEFTQATTLNGDRAVPTEYAQGYTQVTLDELNEYQCIVLAKAP